MDKKRKIITIILIVAIIIVVGLTITLALRQNKKVEKTQAEIIETRKAKVLERLESFKKSELVKQNINETSNVLEITKIIEMLKQEGLVTSRDIIEGNIIYFEGDKNKEKGLDIEKFLRNDSTPNSGGNTTEGSIPDISEMKVGDLVTFDPTEGVDPELLKMTSVVGSAKEGENVSGNGHEDQTLDASMLENKLTSWYVLEKEGQNITLLSAEPTKTQIHFESGIAYLYAEQELHKLCSVYGHHKLSNKELNGQYTYEIGNPEIEGELQTKKIADLGLNTGARSITMRDIEKILGNPNDEEIRTKYDNASYKTKNNPINKIYMPTLKGVDPLGKCADNKKKSNLINSYYKLDKDFFPQLWKEKLFKEDKYHWIASRSTHVNSSGTYFHIRHLNPSTLVAAIVDYGNNQRLTAQTYSCGLRVVSTLNLDSFAEVTKENGAWKITAK